MSGNVVMLCYQHTRIHNCSHTYQGLSYFYEMAKAAKYPVGKVTKSDKSKVSASYKIDPELYKKAFEKCLKESLAQKKRITLSAKVEELIREWLERERA